MKAPSKRRVKKMLKANLRKTKLRPKIKILKTVGRTWVIPAVGTPANRSMACIRYWHYVAIAINHPKLEEVLAEERNWVKL